MNLPKRELKAVITPAVPLFKVYYDDSKDELSTSPVLFLAVWQEAVDFGRGDFDHYATVQAVDHFYETEALGEEATPGDECENAFGLSLTADVDRAQWQAKIDHYKKRIAAHK